MIPVYINNWNALTSVIAMCNYLESIPSVRIIIIDNNSTYEPLLTWYKTCQYELIRIPINLGPYHGFNFIPKSHEHIKRFNSAHFAFTDSDLDISRCPKDLFEVLIEGLARYPQHRKAGLGIELDDLPVDSVMFNNPQNIQRERYLQSNRLDEMFFNSSVDGTMAVYDCHLMGQLIPALRSDRPYFARHLPWYITKSDILDEHIYFYSRVPKICVDHNGGCGYWTHEVRKKLKIIPFI